jgi:hypothetical protein
MSAYGEQVHRRYGEAVTPAAMLDQRAALDQRVLQLREARCCVSKRSVGPLAIIDADRPRRRRHAAFTAGSRRRVRVSLQGMNWERAPVLGLLRVGGALALWARGSYRAHLRAEEVEAA